MNKKQAMEVLEPFLVQGPYENGDYDARCPLHDDKKRSMRVNFKTEQWICFAGCGKGRLAGLLRRIRGEAEGAISGSSKRTIKAKSGSLDPKLVDKWHRSLMGNEHAQDYLWSMRDIRVPTIIRHKLGWDQTSQAFIIPIFLEDGSLFNARKYRPNAPSDKKIWWAVKKDPETDPPLYPTRVLEDSEWVVLCEGEMDALVALQYGFPAISGTAGAGTWRVSWSEQFQDKQVWIVYDRDATGEKGARQVAEYLEPYAKSIYTATIPINKKGADISDYFLSGKSEEEFKSVLKKAKRYQKRITDPAKMNPIDVSVMDSFDSQNAGRSLTMDVLVSGRSQSPYTVPKIVSSTCTMDAGPKCKFCPMLARKGQFTHEIPAWSPTILRMIGHTEASQQEALRKQVNALKCDRLKHDVQSYQAVEQLYIRPSWDESSGDFTPRRIYSVGRHNTMPSQVVHVLGTTWPDPKEQRNEFLAWDVSKAESAIEEFRVTPEIVSQLKKFQPKGVQTPLQKLGKIAQDMEQYVTSIYGRLDLHMAIDLVYHSIASFPFQGKIESRGWLDALIIGDTRTGKSEAARRMVEHYRLGKLVNCEAASFAGIIGGLQQMGGSREWTVTWGVVPMNDRRLVILDEISGLSFDNIQSMSDVRSSGTILLQKIQSEQAWARTRLIWLGNPREASMDEYTYGAQAIAPLIGNREDIARFDFAMALTQHDVGMKEINQIPAIGEPEFSSEDCHILVLWAWSRQPEDILWAEGTEEHVIRAADWLGEHYVADPPLIQAANVRVKIARIAVALAASTFSTDRSGRKVIVNKTHVEGATKFLHSLYSKETFGYYRMSKRESEHQRMAIEMMDDSKRWLIENPGLIRFLKEIQGTFRGEMLEQMMNARREEAKAYMNEMFQRGLISPNGQVVSLSPVLHQLLRELDEEGEQ